MKTLNSDKLDALPGLRLEPETSFNFQCHPGVSCFNRCCRNLNLFLYPYDVLRLRKALEIDSESFLERYTDVVMRPDNAFPDVLLKMAHNQEKTCPFLETSGCSVYADRPDTCRSFPVELGLLFTGNQAPVQVAFFRPPDFCQGRFQQKSWTLQQWIDDQQAATYNQMTANWARIKHLFSRNPWQGDHDPRLKMAFMAAYNIDRFRQFVFESSFLKRYRVKKKMQQKMRASDKQLLEFAFQWIKFMVWQMPNRPLGLY